MKDTLQWEEERRSRTGDEGAAKGSPGRSARQAEQLSPLSRR